MHEPRLRQNSQLDEVLARWAILTISAMIYDSICFGVWRCGCRRNRVFLTWHRCRVILAFAGYVTVVGASSGITAQILVLAFGIAAMIALSTLVSWYETVKISFRTTAPGLAAHPAGGTAFNNIGIGSRSGPLSAVRDAS
jgi:hypothetical protein